LYGKSINNQRIESLWGIIRRQGIQFWMNFFQELIEDGFQQTFNSLVVYALSVQKAFLTGMLISVVSSE
jgi:hypothetical protein